MAKIESNWIDSAKVRKEIYDFNQAVKSVFKYYRYVFGITVPMTMEDIKEPELFSKAFFFRDGAENFNFIEKKVIDPENLNLALKTKCYEYSHKKNEHFLGKVDFEDKPISVSMDLTPTQIEDTVNYPGFECWRKLQQLDPINIYRVTKEQRDKLIDNSMLDEVIANDHGTNVDLLIGRQAVPMIKRTEDITIWVYKEKELEKDGVYTITITSKTPTWTFYSTHHIISFK